MDYFLSFFRNTSTFWIFVRCIFGSPGHYYKPRTRLRRMAGHCTGFSASPVGKLGEALSVHLMFVFERVLAIFTRTCSMCDLCEIVLLNRCQGFVIFVKMRNIVVGHVSNAI